VPAGALVSALALVSGGLLVLGGSSADAVAPPRAHWSATSVVRGDVARARVSRESRPAGTRLVLQRRNLDGWRTVDPTARLTERSWVLRVPTNQLGRFAFRVAAKSGGQVRTASHRADVRVRPTYHPAGPAADHAFLGQRRFRWDPCRPVTWAFNPDHAPHHALAQIRTTIRQARQATGLRFEFAGRTRETPTLRPHHGPYAVIIGWRTPRSFRYFGNHPLRVGVGGASWHSGFEEADGRVVDKAWSGRLILNARDGDDLRPGYGRGYTWGDVILHEFGHVLGLGHARDTTQLMYPQMTQRRARWGAGDLAGLRKLGSARGCLDRVSGRIHGHERAATTLPPKG
jgi:hypothetical protein